MVVQVSRNMVQISLVSVHWACVDGSRVILKSVGMGEDVPGDVKAFNKIGKDMFEMITTSTEAVTLHSPSSRRSSTTSSIQ